MITVYKYESPNKVYIGQSKNYQKRIDQHIYNSRLVDNTDISNLNNWSVLKECETSKEANYWERFYIKKYDSINISTASYNRQKLLQEIMLSTDRDFVFTTEYFKSKGITPDMVFGYAETGWIEKISKSLYKKSGNKITFRNLLYTWNKYHDLDIHEGGLSALGGLCAYIKPKIIIDLYTNSKRALPKYSEKFEFNLFNKKIFIDKYGVNEGVSCVERACIEFISTGEIDEIDRTMSLMITLRPEITQKLLEKCCLIKSKRMFFHFADKHRLPIIDKLDLSKIHLGSGKRVIVRGGKLNSKYGIVI
jgi:predicted GIY-YIG superfamily endonuclease